MKLPGTTLTRAVLAACALVAFCTPAINLQAQKYFPTATKRADLEVGGGYSLSSPDYGNVRFQGITGYAALDVSPHFGVEFDIHQVNTTGNDSVYERTYELGPRYVRHYGRFNPYIRASYGRGVFNYPNNNGNVAYNIFAGALGVDVRVKHHLFVRAEYEGQYWLHFVGNVSASGQAKSLQPDVTTFGAAYHF
jgi:hypothetical protein